MQLKHVFVMMVSLALVFSCGKKKEGKDENNDTKKRSMKHGMGAMVPDMVPDMAPDMKPDVKPPVEKPVAPVAKKPTTPAEAVIAEMEGKVEVKVADSEDYVVATKDMALHAGDQVRVDTEKASAKLRLWDESNVVLGPGAEA
ncbi:hypothetical protein KJ865_16380, partial [Myxococcota bacterium]|nr:hypothetical protein [Myxococcota bacterium]